jgi:hypothetical protein
MAAFIWIPVIPLTILLGLIQLVFIHKDEPFKGSHWFSHGLHIIILMPIFLLAIFNVPFFINLVGLPAGAWYVNEYLVRGVIALVFGIKGAALSHVAKGAQGKGMKESFLHILIMVALVFAAPYVWPLISQALPSWAQ